MARPTSTTSTTSTEIAVIGENVSGSGAGTCLFDEFYKNLSSTSKGCYRSNAKSAHSFTTGRRSVLTKDAVTVLGKFLYFYLFAKVNCFVYLCLSDFAVKIHLCIFVHRNYRMLAISTMRLTRD